MSILVAPDSFKGTFTAAEVSAHIAAGIRSAGGAAVELPVADGGEGTFEVLVRGLDARPVRVSTVGPWGDAVDAAIALTADGTAVVELAFASGLNLPTSGDRDPVAASTYGTGVLMAEAARLGARRLLVAAGGSATTDGGAGAIAAIEERGGLRGAEMVVLSDVTTRFADAARVFGPQKGAGPAAVAVLTRRLELQAGSFAADYGRDPRPVDRTGGGRRLFRRDVGALRRQAGVRRGLRAGPAGLRRAPRRPARARGGRRGPAGFPDRPGQDHRRGSWPVRGTKPCTPSWARCTRTWATTRSNFAGVMWPATRPRWRRGRGGRHGCARDHGTCPPLTPATGQSPNMRTPRAKHWTCPPE